MLVISSLSPSPGGREMGSMPLAIQEGFETLKKI